MRTRCIECYKLAIVEMNQNPWITIGWNSEVDRAIGRNRAHLSNCHRRSRSAAGGCYHRWICRHRRRCSISWNRSRSITWNRCCSFSRRLAEQMQILREPENRQHASTAGDKTPEEVTPGRLRLPGYSPSVISSRGLALAAICDTQSRCSFHPCAQQDIEYLCHSYSPLLRCNREQARYEHRIICRYPTVDRAGDQQSDPAEDKNNIGTIKVWIDAPTSREKEHQVQQHAKESGWPREQTKQCSYPYCYLTKSYKGSK